jgi:hypothetical protein
MGCGALQLGHSSWEETMRYDADKDDKPSYAESTPGFIPIPADPSSTNDTWKGVTDNDADDPQSENGSCSSIALSFTSDSRSAMTSLSTSASCQSDDDDEDRAVFPSYDDLGYHGNYEQVEDLESPESPRTYDTCAISQSSNSTAANSKPESPELIKHPKDDTAVRFEASRHVDYLSRDWLEGDIWASRKYIATRRKSFANSHRLENTLWRTWGKRRGNVKTISPESLNWYDIRYNIF